MNYFLIAIQLNGVCENILIDAKPGTWLLHAHRTGRPAVLIYSEELPNETVFNLLGHYIKTERAEEFTRMSAPSIAQHVF